MLDERALGPGEGLLEDDDHEVLSVPELVARPVGPACPQSEAPLSGAHGATVQDVVEQATGRRVKTFLSESTVDDDVAVEIFLLGEARTDMSGFEGA